MTCGRWSFFYEVFMHLLRVLAVRQFSDILLVTRSAGKRFGTTYRILATLELGEVKVRSCYYPHLTFVDFSTFLFTNDCVYPVNLKKNNSAI